MEFEHTITKHVKYFHPRHSWGGKVADQPGGSGAAHPEVFRGAAGAEPAAGGALLHHAGGLAAAQPGGLLHPPHPPQQDIPLHNG